MADQLFIAGQKPSDVIYPYQINVTSANGILGVQSPSVALPTLGVLQTLTAAQSNTTFNVITSVANSTIALPAASSGLSFKFIITSIATPFSVRIQSTASNIYGSAVTGAAMVG